MNVIILAAGQGKRMKSSLPKVLHPILGMPILFHVLKAAKTVCRDGLYVVIGVGAHEVRQWTEGFFTKDRFCFIEQKEQRGTGHAVLQAAPYRKKLSEDILVMCGDTPLITPASLKTVMRQHRRRKAQCTVLTAMSENPYGYGRVIRSHDGQVLKIVEEADASADEKSVKEINSSTYCFRRDALFECLKEIKPQNRQHEFYLTDVIGRMIEKGMTVEANCTEDSREVSGINSRADLASVTSLMKQRVTHELMLSGVTFLDPASASVDAGVKIGHDSVIYPFCVLEGNVRIGENCRIGPSCTIRNSVIGNGTTALHSVITDSVVQDGSRIGPFTHLRPGTRIGRKVRVGNFVEIKNSAIRDGATCAHLTYLGDARVGKRVNVGAGTITCNYDGQSKHKTVIDDGAFIGSDTVLVAPVKVGKNAYTAAGSVITKEVPAHALGVGRARQVNIARWTKEKKRNKIKK